METNTKRTFLEEIEPLLDKAPQIIAIFIALALIYSTSYNFGYFSLISSEAMTILTINDYLESTLPLLIIGPSLYMFNVMVSGRNIISIKAFIEKEKKFFQILRDEKSILGAILITLISTPFILLQVVGIYGLYFLLLMKVFIVYLDFNSSDMKILTDFSIYLHLGIMILLIVADYFFWVEESSYIKFVIRYLLIPCYILFLFGQNTLANQLQNKHQSLLLNCSQFHNSDLNILRFLEKGIFTYDKKEKIIYFLPNDKIDVIKKPFPKSQLELQSQMCLK